MEVVILSHSKYEVAYNTIKDKIISGTLPPRSYVSEDALIEEFNMSRTPIREALQTLQKEGFVSVYPRKGIFITDITPELLANIYDTRMIAEPYIAQMACGNVSDDFVLALKDKFLHTPSGISGVELSNYFAELDTEYHTMQYNYCHNHFIIDTMRIIDDHEKRIRRICFDPSENSYCINEHVEMIECFLCRDVPKLMEKTIKHIERARSLCFSRFGNGSIQNIEQAYLHNQWQHMQ